jgi:hypothetical protein
LPELRGAVAVGDPEAIGSGVDVGRVLSDGEIGWICELRVLMAYIFRVRRAVGIGVRLVVITGRMES